MHVDSVNFHFCLKWMRFSSKYSYEDAQVCGQTPQNSYTQLFKVAAGRLFRVLVDLSCQSAFCLLRLIQKY